MSDTSLQLPQSPDGGFGRSYRGLVRGRPMVLTKRGMTMTHHLGRRTAVAAAAALLGAAAVVAPASAEQIEKWHDEFTDSHIEQEAHGEDFCGGGFSAPVLFEGVFEFRGHAVVRGDGLVYFAESVRVVQTWTNTETDATFVDTTKIRGGDWRITDNGDGTLTIVFADRGTHTAEADGEVIAREAGLFRGSFLVDHGGTPGDPSDDEFITDLGDEKHVGLLGFEGRDFCEELRTYVG